MISPSAPLSMWRESPFVRAFLAGLRDLGYEEGRNIAIEFRSAEENWERLPDIAAELVALKVDVLISNVCGATLTAAMRATNTIPIVVGACNDDMVETGIIASLACEASRRACRQKQAAVDVPISRGSKCRRLDVLRTEHPRLVQARRGIRGQDSEGSQARGLAGRTADQVRAGHQPQDGQGARAKHTNGASTTRR